MCGGGNEGCELFKGDNSGDAIQMKKRQYDGSIPGVYRRSLGKRVLI